MDLSRPLGSEQTLLAHVEGVRRLAFRLVRDPHAAEDVAQETMRIALERPPREGWPLGSWLAGVTRRVAWSRMRAEARRRRHEGAAARAEADPREPRTGESVAERVARERLVIDAVAVLPEAYGRAIVLRYFDGLPPREVAARLSVPVETARTRLRRAIERLRVDLDRRHGSRRAWCALLAPVAIRPAAPRVSPLPEVLVSSTVAKSAVAAVVIACLGLAAWRLSAAGGTAAGDAPAGRESSAAGDASRAPSRLARAEGGARAGRAGAEAPVPAPDPSHAAGSDPAGAALTGRVLGADGLPVSGARVRLTPDDPLVSYLGVDTAARWSTLSAVTDAEGRFAFESVRPGPGYALLAQAPDRGALHHARGLTLAARSSVARDVALAPGAALSGRVVSSDGKPIAGARVAVCPTLVHPLLFVLARSDAQSVVEAAVETDASGAWRAPRVSPGEKTLIVERAGFAAAVSRAKTPATGDATAPDVVLEPARRIEGRAVFADGRPAPRTRVLATYDDGKVGYAADAGPDGAFAFDAVPAGEAELWGFLPGMAPAIGARARDGERAAVVRLSAPGVLRGRVLSAEDGTPIPRFALAVFPASPDVGDLMGTFIESTLRSAIGPQEFRSETGEFTIENVEPRTVRIDVVAEGFLAFLSDPVAVAAGPAGELVVLRLPSGRGVRGVVVGPDGAPVAGAAVRLEKNGDGFSFPEPPREGVEITLGGTVVKPLETVTGDDGSFAFPAAVVGTHGLTVVSPRFAPAFVGGIRVGDARLEPLRVVLSAGATVTGRLAGGLRPVTGVPVHLLSPLGSLETTADSAGAFRFERVPPGAWLLAPMPASVRSGIYEEMRAFLVAHIGAVELSLRDGERAERVIALPELAVVEGAIRDAPAGAVLSKSTVILFSADIEKGFGLVYQTTAGEDGKFTFPLVAPGEYRASILVDVRRAGTSEVLVQKGVQREVSVPRPGVVVTLDVSAGP